MRLTEFVTAQQSLGANTATVFNTQFKSPTWATRATLYFSTLITGTGTGTADLVLTDVIPVYSLAPVVAETVTGTTGVFEVQTVTMTGEPTSGAVKFTVTDQGTTTTYNTAFMPLADAKRRPALIAERLSVNGMPNSNDIAWTVSLGTGATTPTVFTATWRGVRTGLQTAVAVDSSRAFTQVAQAVNFADWDGVTQLTQATTTTVYDVIRISPGETGIADDDTAHNYKINAQLPEYLNAKITVSAIAANNTVSYSLYCTYSS